MEIYSLVLGNSLVPVEYQVTLGIVPGNSSVIVQYMAIYILVPDNSLYLHRTK